MTSASSKQDARHPKLVFWDNRGMGWEGRREGLQDGGTRVYPWLIHVDVWQKTPQYCQVISLQLIKINGKKNDS